MSTDFDDITRRLDAKTVAHTVVDDVALLAFADQEDGEGPVLLMVQRRLEDDRQDIELGMDRHCLVDGDGRTFYGGVATWAVEDLRLKLTLSEEAAQSMRCGNIEVVLPDLDTERMVQTAMRELLSRN